MVVRPHARSLLEYISSNSSKHVLQRMIRRRIHQYGSHASSSVNSEARSFVGWKRQFLLNCGEWKSCSASFSTNVQSTTKTTTVHNKKTKKRRLSGSFSSVWEQRFQELKAFREEHGHCHVPSAKDGEYSQLYTWIENQRRAYRKLQQQQQKHQSPQQHPKQDQPNEQSPSPNNNNNKKLSLLQSRLDRLQDELSLDMDPRATLWSTRYEELCEFYAHHGHCRVPDQYPPNPELGRWVRTQRYQYHLQAPFSNLTHKRKELLNQMGFCWDAQQENWMDYWYAYMENKQKGKNEQSSSRGDSFLLTDDEQEEESFDDWIDKHIFHKHDNGDDNDDDYDHPSFPSSISAESLARWVRHQRQQFSLYRQGRVTQHALTPNRIDRLKQAGIINELEDDDPYAPRQVDDE